MREHAKKSPEYFANAAVYQINLRTFTQEGTIAAATKKLQHIKDTGFKIVYLCPMNESDPGMDEANWSNRQKASKTGNPKNPYRMTDYFLLDNEEYGTDEDLKTFVETAHKLGMRVMFDLVYMHCGPNAYFIADHPDFIQHDAEGNVVNTLYHFPFINFDSQELREYLWSNMTYFIEKFDVDGYRCDVGDEVPLDFWAEGYRRMAAIKPDAVLINEGVKNEYLRNVFDASYSWDWSNQIYAVFAERQPADLLRKSWCNSAAGLPLGGKLLRCADNHDTATDWPARLENTIGHNGMDAVQVLNYMIDGMPMVYCGNEIADGARHSMFANRFYRGGYETVDWDCQQQPYSRHRQQLILTLNRIRAQENVIANGETTWLDNTAPEQVLSFVRFDDRQKVLVLLNVTDKPVTATLQTPVALQNTEPMLKSGCTVTAKPLQTEVALQPYGYFAAKIEKIG